MLQLAFYLGRKADNPSAHWMDRLICWWTGSPYSHVEFVEARPGGGIGACWSASNRDGRVRRKWIDLNSGHWHLVTAADHNPVVMLERFLVDEGRRYGWLGAASHAVPTPLRPLLRWADRKRRYCSQQIALGLGWSDSHVTPGELHERITGAARP